VEEGPGRAAAPPRPLLAVLLLAVPNVTAHPSTASVPITVKGLTQLTVTRLFIPVISAVIIAVTEP